MTADLLDALDALTKPTTDRQPAGSLREGETITRPCLLAQLREAIASDLTAGGGKSLTHERIPINPVALELYGRIERDIGDAYAAISGKPPALNPEDVLRAWYVVFTQGNPRPEIIDEWTARLHGWAREIDAMFHPTMKVELVDSPCIICGKAEVIDENGNLITAVITEYRIQDEAMRIEQTTCRACKEVWEGEHGASSFRRYADEQADAAVEYQHVIDPGDRIKYKQALEQATAAFKGVGTLYGRVRVTHTPTPADPAWRFAAHIHETAEATA